MLCLFWTLAVLVLNSVPGFAQIEPRNLAVVMTGLSGSHAIAGHLDEAVRDIRIFLRSNGYAEDETFVFREKEDPERGVRSSSRDELEAFFKQAAAESYDRIFIFVAGHANGRDETARLHLPGPDVEYGTLLGWIDGLKAKRFMIVAAVPQGHVWLEKLGGAGRVVIAGNGLRVYDFLPLHFLRFFPSTLSRGVSEDPFAPRPKADVFSLRDALEDVQKRILFWYRVNRLHQTELALFDADGDGRGESLFAGPDLNAGHRIPGKAESLAFEWKTLENGSTEPVMDFSSRDAALAGDIMLKKSGGLHVEN